MVWNFFLLVTVCFSQVLRIAYAKYRTNIPDTSWDYGYGYKPAQIGNRNWYYGSATFYARKRNSGACGYPWSVIDNSDTAAVPQPRYSDAVTAGAGDVDGAACGQCYWLKCINVPRYYNTVFCKPGAVKILIVDYDVPGQWVSGVWPDNHFDLQPKTFGKLAEIEAGIINVRFRRAGCPRNTPKWTLGQNSNPFWKDVNVYDVPYVGSIHLVYAKPSNRGSWYKGVRSWGAHWSFLGGFVFDSNTTIMLLVGEGKGSIRATYAQTDD